MNRLIVFSLLMFFLLLGIGASLHIINTTRLNELVSSPTREAIVLVSDGTGSGHCC